MLIYFLGGKSGFSDKVISHDFDQEPNCLFFDKIGTFAKAIKTKRPELVLADKDYSTGGFDLKNFLSEQKISSPVIFFNSVNADEKKLADFWYYQITPFIKKNGASRYKRCIEFISKKMKMSAPLEEKKDANFLYKIKESCNISEKLFELFKYLYKAENPVSIEKIQNELVTKGKKYTINCLNVQLSRLKKQLASNTEYDIRLIKELEGYKLVIF